MLSCQDIPGLIRQQKPIVVKQIESDCQVNIAAADLNANGTIIGTDEQKKALVLWDQWNRQQLLPPSPMEKILHKAQMMEVHFRESYAQEINAHPDSFQHMVDPYLHKYVFAESMDTYRGELKTIEKEAQMITDEEQKAVLMGFYRLQQAELEFLTHREKGIAYDYANVYRYLKPGGLVAFVNHYLKPGELEVLERVAPNVTYLVMYAKMRRAEVCLQEGELEAANNLLNEAEDLTLSLSANSAENPKIWIKYLRMNALLLEGKTREATHLAEMLLSYPNGANIPLLKAFIVPLLSPSVIHDFSQKSVSGLLNYDRLSKLPFEALKRPVFDMKHIKGLPAAPSPQPSPVSQDSSESWPIIKWVVAKAENVKDWTNFIVSKRTVSTAPVIQAPIDNSPKPAKVIVKTVPPPAKEMHPKTEPKRQNIVRHDVIKEPVPQAALDDAQKLILKQVFGNIAVAPVFKQTVLDVIDATADSKSMDNAAKLIAFKRLNVMVGQLKSFFTNKSKSEIESELQNLESRGTSLKKSLLYFATRKKPLPQDIVRSVLKPSNI